MKKTLPTLLIAAVSLAAGFAHAKAAEAERVAPGVYFYASGKGCNTGWVVFKDYVLVIDANFPHFAEETIPLIRETTDKPIRFVFNTHHHGDHAFGNGVYAAEGAVPVAQDYCLDILRQSRDAFKQWAQGKPAYQDRELRMPDISFADELVYDDGEMRVELMYFGHGHTKGDAVAYLPRQKILFSGDLCVNGAFNYLGDANTKSWVEVLNRLQGLDIETICPGHGGIAGKELLETQKQYFVQLREQVLGAVRAGKSIEETKAAVDIPMYKEWTGVDVLERNIENVYAEIAGLKTPWELLEIGMEPGPSPTRDGEGWTPPKTFIARNLDDEGLNALKLVAPNMEIINAKSNAEIMEHIGKADGMMGPVNKEQLEAAENLRWAHSRTAGISYYLFPEFVESDVVLTNGQAVSGEAIADHVMGMLLMFTKDLAAQYEQQQHREWEWVRRKAMVLKDKTMLVLGFGGIGQKVAKRASGFEMRILAIDPVPKAKPRYVEAILPPDRMNEVLPEADVVVCCVPLTRHTHRYFGKEQFDLMKESAYFVNIARGQVVNQEDMIEALESGSIAGAGLDVTDPEPLPPDHPLWKAPNVIITPHMSGKTEASGNYAWWLLRENVRRFAAGEPLLNVVNKEAGY